MKGGVLSSAKSLNLLSSGKTSFPRSGLSFRLISAHRIAIFAKLKASSTGQSGTKGSNISWNVPFSIERFTW
ncbi:hypothetical protein KSS87_007182 [Heliosperma pusillum]|nr:hypothetical protein KSS87_007182 [Heliosperma pusillum]